MNEAQADHIPEARKNCPLVKFLRIAAALDDDTIVTPEIFSELITMAARLEEIDREARGGPPKSL